MRRFVIERQIPKLGSFEREQMRAPAGKSDTALSQLAPKVQRVHSSLAGDKTFCMAEDQAGIRKHADMSRFPANKIAEVRKMVDPTTASA